MRQMQQKKVLWKSQKVREKNSQQKKEIYKKKFSFDKNMRLVTEKATYKIMMMVHVTFDDHSDDDDGNSTISLSIFECFFMSVAVFGCCSLDG